MRVFVTGASGWIGSATVRELLANGHEVIGLARSDASAAAVESAGAEVLRGDLDDLDSLRSGARAADGVVHLANKHDFANMAVSNAAERGAVEVFGQELARTGKPLVIASGMAGHAEGRPSTENDRSDQHGPQSMRGGTENLALGFAEQGIRSVAARFAPTVHGMGDHGFIARLAQIAVEKGVAGYVGDGASRWPAVHRDDAARLVRLGLEQAPAGTILHAVAESGVASRDIAAALGAALGVPSGSIPAEQAMEHFGWIGMFFARDLPSSSDVTRERFGWEPTGPTLLEDIAAGAYSA